MTNTKQEITLTVQEVERIYNALGVACDQLKKANDYIESLGKLKEENEKLMKTIKVYSWDDEEASKKTVMAMIDKKMRA
jgi:hypothetical protein